MATADGATVSGTDSGADFFIANGTRWLDLAQETDKEAAQYDESFAIGDWRVLMENCRVVKEVWFRDSEGSRTKLTPTTRDALREDYPKLSGEDNGTATKWAPYISRFAPSQVGSGQQVKYNSVMIMPPTDAAITIEVFGIFHSLELKENIQENYWSVNYPDVLVLASLMSMEGFYRNTQGVNDYLNQINAILRGIDVDTADAMTVESMQMEG
ncbi:hypothetical protein HN911_11690 [Candidatus Bathyarchaeota archaeon]|nr:hypothetical protein [Candidatus Bathyarchaeota archaeon]